MSSSSLFWIVPVVLALWVLGAYQRLSRRRLDVLQAFAAFDLHVTVRHNLIRTLVELVRKHVAQERLTLRAVIAARKAVHAALAAARPAPLQVAGIAELGRAEHDLAPSLATLLAAVPGYPELAAEPTLGATLEALAQTDHRIALARQAFNDAVAAYNGAIGEVPTLILARLFRFTPAMALAATTSKAIEPAAQGAAA